MNNNYKCKSPSNDRKISINLKRLNAVSSDSNNYVQKVADLLNDPLCRRIFYKINLVNYIGTLYKSDSFLNEQYYRDRTRSMVKKEVNLKLENIFQQPLREIKDFERKRVFKFTASKVSTDINIRPIKHYQYKLLKYCKEHVEKADNSSCPDVDCKQYMENVKPYIPHQISFSKSITDHNFTRSYNKISSKPSNTKSELSSHKKGQLTTKSDTLNLSSNKPPQQVYLNKPMQTVTKNHYDVNLSKADKINPTKNEKNDYLSLIHSVACGTIVKQNNLSKFTAEPNEQKANVTNVPLYEVKDDQMIADAESPSPNTRKARLSKENIQEMIRSSVKKSTERNPEDNNYRRRSTNSDFSHFSESGDQISSDYEFYNNQTDYIRPNTKGFNESIVNYLALAGSYQIMRRTYGKENRTWSGTLLNHCRITKQSACNHFGHRGFIDGIDGAERSSKKTDDPLKENEAFNALSHMFTLKRLLEGRMKNESKVEKPNSIEEKAKSQNAGPTFLLKLLEYKGENDSINYDPELGSDSLSFDETLVNKFRGNP